MEILLPPVGVRISRRRVFRCSKAPLLQSGPVPLTIFTSDRFADHLNPPGHPERVERAEMMQVVASEFRKGGGDVREPRAATQEEITRVHDADYFGLIKETAGRAVALDPDTFTSDDSYDVAMLAAGLKALGDEPLAASLARRCRPCGHRCSSSLPIRP